MPECGGKGRPHRFCMFSGKTGLSGKTDTHLRPQIFSSRSVAGIQLMRSCVFSSKICEILSGIMILPFLYEISAFSITATVLSTSKQPALIISSIDIIFAVILLSILPLLMSVNYRCIGMYDRHGNTFPVSYVNQPVNR